MAKRTRSKPGQPKNKAPRADSQLRAKVKAQLESLRKQIGTAELARRMGIPAPSLRRMLGHGKGAGLPRELQAINRVLAKIKSSRKNPEIVRREQCKEAALRAKLRGTLNLEYLAISEEFGFSPQEVYTFGESPNVA